MKGMINKSECDAVNKVFVVTPHRNIANISAFAEISGNQGRVLS
jgi:mRNA degradation ribonuclease J1/J2